MNGAMGAGMWIWTLIGVLLLVLLAVLIIKQCKK
jgi:LPXTG-motif cell wall-anchored protein